MIPKPRFHFVYLVIAVLGVLILHDLWERAQGVTSIPYSDFRRLLKENKVEEVAIAGDELRGTLKAAEPSGVQRFTTVQVADDLAAALDEQGVRYNRVVQNDALMTLLSWVLPTLLFVGIWLLLMRRLGRQMGPGGGLMAIGKSKAKVFVETDIKTRFDDVAGAEEAKDELVEIVSFLKDPQQYGRLGARMPKGVLLVGPPGTGKTLLARAVAGEAETPFFSISGAEFVEMFVGVGAARVRDLFEQARQKAPCIIFIDELDALGRARSAHPMAGGHDEKEQTLNQLLVELDGFDATAGIVILAATNRPEILDPALLRAGRFDRQVVVDRPDRRGRDAILRVHMKKVTLSDDVAPEQLAALTPGFSGADLANLVNEAALAATRRGGDDVTMADFLVAIERLVAGLEKKNRVMHPREREVVAYHEMGHALVAAALKGDPVQKVSIIPRSIGALGYTMQRPTDDRYLLTTEELEARMAVLLGGRAAEHVIFGHLSTGAADDLSKVTDLARNMVTRFAMVPALGHVAFESEPVGYLGMPGAGVRRLYSEDTAREIDCAIRAFVRGAYERAETILTANRTLLEESTAALLEKETLAEGELAPFFARLAPPPEAPAA